MCWNTPAGLSGIFLIFLLSGRRKRVMKTTLGNLNLTTEEELVDKVDEMCTLGKSPILILISQIEE